MVLIIIGILSALGIGLFAGRSAFSPLLAQQQLSSAVVLAQQAGLAGNGANALTVTQAADDFVFAIRDGVTTVQEFRIARAGTSISAPSLPLSITFDGLGEPYTAGDTQFIISGDSTYRVCLSSLGAVYGGVCPP
jgi:MSHA pilin protein MshC